MHFFLRFEKQMVLRASHLILILKIRFFRYLCDVLYIKL